MMKLLQLKKVMLTGVCLLLLIGSLGAQTDNVNMHEGVVRVKFKRELSSTLKGLKSTRQAGVLSTGIEAFDAASKQVSAKNMKRVFPYSAKHDAKHRKHGLDLWYEVQFDNTVNPLHAVSAYSASADVEMVEPVYKKVHIKGEAVPFSGSSLKSAANAPFDDQFLGEQWHYENNGSLSPSIAEADINVYEAWKTQAGQPNVVVSVVDGGIDTEHADLKDNLWVNQTELNGDAGVDDDGNGYVDDIYGYNFADNSGSVTAHDHGTHVAGTVAAVNNNGIGVAGVAGGTGNGDGARLMSSQVFTSAGGVGGFASAIVYGADNGAVISQNSWGYKSAGVVEQTVLAAIDYFIEEAGRYEGSPMQGGIVIFAAGNDFVDAEMYPGYYDKTFCVAALGPDNTIAHYSNHGAWVDISAPGGDQMVSQVAGVLSTAPNNSYAYMQGTSMACPHVSGIAALAVAEHGGPNFTADELRLYLESSTHDVDQYNPDFAGKLGVGYIDAAMVLKKNEGITPDVVSDLTLTGIAQDFATLTWTVPADSDDGYPSNFQLFYHSETVTESNVADATLVSINNIDAAGTVKQFELTDLEPLTTYHFAIRSMDRWANKSALSANVTGTTNAGPDINIPTLPLNYTLNNANSFTDNTQSFVIENLDEGLLKWEGIMRHKSHYLDYNALDINYPVASASASKASYNVKKVPSRIQHIEATASQPVELTGFKDEIKFADGNIYIIGEGDVTLTNSSAMKFYVDREDGFNLTNVEMFVRHDPETGPMVMEIYEGDELDNAKLVTAQEVESYSPDPYDLNVQLDEQLYFNYGQTFWVVFHVPVGNTYCLGAQVELDPSYSDYSYMSFDMGKTWHPLSSLIDDFYTWSTVAVSNNKYLGEYITLTPTSGTVEPNQTQDVQLAVDGATLINGNYSANILVKANDSDEKESRLGISMRVEEQQPDLRNIDVIDYGSVFNGTSKTLIIPVTNFGYGNFYGISSSVSDPQFEVTHKDWSISARDYGYITVKYTPDGAGNDNAIVTLTDQKGHTHNIRLFGVGTNPAKISVSPAEQILADMAIGETATTTFSIANVGEYPLNYKVSAYDDQALTHEDRLRHKFGYTYESNVDGNIAVPFEWQDITTTGVDVSDYFKNVHPNYTYKELELGFDFPFYEHKVQRVYITRNGVLTFDKEGPFGNCAPPSFDPRCSPKGAISVMGWPFDINRKGSIHYKKEGDKVIVQYTDVFFEEVEEYLSGTFQVVLYNNGDIDFRYKDIEWMDYLDTYQALIGIGNPEYDDELRISGADYQYGYDRYGILTSNETIFKVKHPGAALVESLSKTSGYIAPGESEEITVTVNTANVNEGQLYQNISILSNDPFASATPFTVNVNVNAGGMAEPVIDRTEVNFGQVFAGATTEQLLTVVNNGNKDVEITSATFAGSGFAIGTNYPKVLKAKTSEYIPVSMVTDAVATLSDVLTITCADGTVFTVALTGEVIAAPQIEVDVTSFSETLDAGTKVVRPVTITNNGANPLELLITGNDFIYEQETVAPLSVPEFDYSYATSDDWESGVTYAWDDIVKDGVKTPNSWYAEHQQLWKEVELPFEIKLFNQPSNKLWVSWQGLATTVEPRINPPYIGPEIFPNTTEPNSLIAPYFGIHNYDRNEEEALVSGVYHKIYDDRVVIQWNECFDKYGLGSNYSFQAIIYTNGVIKYQYKAGGFDTWYHLGIVGLENAQGDDGVLVAGYQNYLKDQFAVVLTPAEKRIVPANGSATFDIAIDATYLNDGWYAGNVNIINNTPDQPSFSIPVDLVVIGEPAIDVPAAIEFGEVMAYEVEDNWGWPEPQSYVKEFEITNTGSASLLFSSLTLSDYTEMTPEWYVNSRGFWRWVPIQEQLSFWDPIELMPGETRKVRINFTPTGDVTDFNIDFTIASNLVSGDVVIPITAKAFKAPAVALEGEIDILANTTAHAETGSLLLSNVNGQGPLEYSLSIDYNRTGAEAASVYGHMQATTALQSVQNEVPVVSSYAQSNETFDTTLEYDTKTAADIFTGYGEGQAFMPGIVFNAPAEGFKLSHVKTWYNPKDVLTSDMTVYVLAGGTGFEDAKVLTEQAYTHSVEEAVEGGGFVTIELNEPQQFYPNEKFYIVIAYQLGIEYPQGTAVVEEPVAGRYFFPTDDGWLDVTDVESLAGYAWMIKALEKEHVSASWVRITTPTTGVIEAGQSLNVEMEFNAAGVIDADNYAKLIVESNDPLNPQVERSMYLRLNQGPTFTIAPEVILSVEENSTLSFDVTASDYEGDACTFELTEANELVTLSVTEDVLTITYSPDYVSAGVNVISITGTDVHNNASVLDIPVEVINVNRLPEITEAIEVMDIVLEDGIVDIALAKHIIDPDGDALTFEVISSDYNTLDVFLSGDKLKMEPLSVVNPDVEVTVTASDIHGATFEHAFMVKVIHRTGFDDTKANSWRIYPNPASSVINIEGVAAEATIHVRILNAAGTIVKESQLPWNVGQAQTVGIDELSKGIYLLEIQDGEKSEVYKLIKK